MKYKSLEEYRQKHSLCPECKSKNIITTCAGYIFDEKYDFADENSATCQQCKWKGIVDDLQPDETEVLVEFKNNYFLDENKININEKLQILFKYIDKRMEQIFNKIQEDRGDIRKIEILNKINFIMKSLEKDIIKYTKYLQMHLEKK